MRYVNTEDLLFYFKKPPIKPIRHIKKFYPSKWIGRIVEFRELGSLDRTKKLFRGKIIDAADRLAIAEVYKEGLVFVKNNDWGRGLYSKNKFKKEQAYFPNENLDKKFFYLIKWSGGRWKPAGKIRPNCVFCSLWRYFQRKKKYESKRTNQYS